MVVAGLRLPIDWTKNLILSNLMLLAVGVLFHQDLYQAPSETIVRGKEHVNYLVLKLSNPESNLSW